MATWHRIGDAAELRARVPCALSVERHTIALFHYEGRFRALGNACNHKGGPLCQGRMQGEFVVCPWHGWEYSVVTGRGPEGYDEEQVPVFEVANVMVFLASDYASYLTGEVVSVSSQHP